MARIDDDPLELITAHTAADVAAVDVAKENALLVVHAQHAARQVDEVGVLLHLAHGVSPRGNRAARARARAIHLLVRALSSAVLLGDQLRVFLLTHVLGALAPE